jgi:hypothetical protein
MRTQRLNVEVLPYMMKALEQKMHDDDMTKRAVVEEALTKYLGLDDKKSPLERMENNVYLVAENQKAIAEYLEELESKLEKIAIKVGVKSDE